MHERLYKEDKEDQGKEAQLPAISLDLSGSSPAPMSGVYPYMIAYNDIA